ncbi:male sterility protein-domain-containing protein [Mycena pura]|uniref:Fatty acyl-CoA reductase n=1 Tax=Mycena pura TaxID=153505 RepID=A0AAD6VHZ5_9AGAR|nr:male sterility protein-domain-containing protein [Mycena pura]
MNINTVDYELPSAFFKNHTVLLTGGTGCLGACLLFKLALQADTRRVYVLVRGSVEHAKLQWAASMAGHIDGILATGRVELLVGDVRKKHLGLDPGVLAELADAVTLVIHCAANISLMSSLHDTIRDNCLPTLALAELASGFKHLSRFVYVSTAYANMFLPGGPVEERIYETHDAERQLAAILETGSEPSMDVELEGFPTPYTFVKHLTERLLLLRHPRLAVLLFRPTFLGPAISQPFPYYARDGSAPVSKMMEKAIEFGIRSVAEIMPAHPGGGAHVLDEIPVDLAANLLLLHCMHGSTGPVHACAQSYVPRTIAQVVADGEPHTRQVRTRIQKQKYSARAGISTAVALRFYAIVTHVGRNDWHFSNAASRKFAEVGGPLGMKLHASHDPEKYFAERAMLMAEKVRANAGASRTSKL